MGFYLKLVLPWLLDLAMRNRQLAGYRHAVISAARGRVLEAGYMPGPKPWAFIYQGQRRQLVGTCLGASQASRPSLTSSTTIARDAMPSTPTNSA